MVTEIRTAEKDSRADGHAQYTDGLMDIQLYLFVKTQTLHLKLVHELCLNEN